MRGEAEDAQPRGCELDVRPVVEVFLAVLTSGGGVVAKDWRLVLRRAGWRRVSKEQFAPCAPR